MTVSSASAERNDKHVCSFPIFISRTKVMAYISFSDSWKIMITVITQNKSKHLKVPATTFP